MTDAESAQRSIAATGQETSQTVDAVGTATGPVFLDGGGRRRRWVRASGAMSVAAGMAFLGALVLVLHSSPVPPVAHEPDPMVVTSVIVQAPNVAGPLGAKQ